ncbi:chloride channel protein [Pseudonocardia spirodelae]|uniref:Chloride channel protein n=1 Tax=Pseudonocardia spirodelae TaxID=3133431 RepID=A0ABU8T877_9PSEU
MPRRPSERRRVPAPVLRTRIGSKRAATDQPNVTGDGDSPLTVRFWVLLVLTGVAAGLSGIALMALLHAVSEWAYGPGAGTGLLAAVERADTWGRVWPLLLAGAVAGPGWYLLRRFVPGRTDVDDAVWTGDARLGLRRSAGTAVLSEVVVGLGASLGREAAPKLMGGVWAALLAVGAGLTVEQRRLLVACGAGAGLACVYDVPLGGALFVAEVLVGTVRLPVVLPALACTATATVTAWAGLPAGPVYPGLTAPATTPSLLVWALPAGLLIGVLATGWVRLIALVSHRGPRRTGWRLTAPLVAFGLLALAGTVFPQLYGNGADLAEQAFLGGGALLLFAALAVLKPLVTALCLGSGASGGLFTPTLCTGAVAGAALGGAWSLLWPGSPVGAFAMVGAAAMIGAGMQAPLAGLVLVLELTGTGFGIAVPLVVATLVATAVARWLDGYSIYSARLAAQPSSEQAT